MWKILTAHIRVSIYYSVISCGLFNEEQKGCYMETRGTGELLYIDLHFNNESKTRRTNEAMARIDHKMTYNMESTELDYRLSQNVLNIRRRINFIEKSVETSREELTVGDKFF